MNKNQRLVSWGCLALLLATSGLRGGDATGRAAEPISVPLSRDGETAPAFQGPADVTRTKSETLPRGEGFVPLFPDAGALTGWRVHDGRSQAWIAEEGIVSCIAHGGGWLLTEREYSDFILKLEYRIRPGGNTGIGLRCPPTGNPTFTGFEIQLIDDDAPKYADLRPDQYTGSIYYQVPAERKARLNPAGEWNRCEIRCLGDELTVAINGEVVNRVTLSRQDAANDPEQWSLAHRPPVGHIALQSHSSRVDFRNVLISDLTVRTRSGLQYVELAGGDGEALPDRGMVTVHYVGQLASGKRFSDSRDLGEPVTVDLDAVIDGWKEGLQGMKVGGRRRLIVPPTLAYGSRGVEGLIPPDATLVFEVELCGFDR